MSTETHTEIKMGDRFLARGGSMSYGIGSSTAPHAAYWTQPGVSYSLRVTGPRGFSLSAPIRSGTTECPLVATANGDLVYNCASSPAEGVAFYESGDGTKAFLHGSECKLTYNPEPQNSCFPSAKLACGGDSPAAQEHDELADNHEQQEEEEVAQEHADGGNSQLLQLKTVEKEDDSEMARVTVDIGGTTCGLEWGRDAFRLSTTVDEQKCGLVMVEEEVPSGPCVDEEGHQLEGTYCNQPEGTTLKTLEFHCDQPEGSQFTLQGNKLVLGDLHGIEQCTLENQQSQDNSVVPQFAAIPGVCVVAPGIKVQATTYDPQTDQHEDTGANQYQADVKCDLSEEQWSSFETESKPPQQWGSLGAGKCVNSQGMLPPHAYLEVDEASLQIQCLQYEECIGYTHSGDNSIVYCSRGEHTTIACILQLKGQLPNK